MKNTLPSVCYVQEHITSQCLLPECASKFSVLQGCSTQCIEVNDNAAFQMEGCKKGTPLPHLPYPSTKSSLNFPKTA